MSILGKIFGSIFGAGSAQAAQATAGGSSAAPGTVTNPAPAAPPVSGSSPGVAQPAPHSVEAAGAQAPVGQPVDVTAILDKAVSDKGQHLDWRKSIVDLMKALDIDSSLSARKELARDLHYTGDTDDSATMNIWLHKQVMTKLKENGGTLPADLAS